MAKVSDNTIKARMTISLIIPTYNRPLLLRHTLAAVAQLELLPDEVIIVDDGSPYHYKPEARSYKLRLIRQSHKGQAATLNTGVRAARGDICCFLDDDCTPEPDWLVHLMAPFTDPDVIGVSGAIHYVHPDYEPEWGDRVVQNQKGRWPMSGNMAYRRDLLFRLGGFDEELPAYFDKDCALRALDYGRLIPAPRARVFHAREPWTPELLKSKVSNASTWVTLANRHDIWKDKNNPPPVAFRTILFPRDYAAIAKRIFMIPLLALASLVSKQAAGRLFWEWTWFKFLIRQRLHIWQMSAQHEKVFI